MEAVRVYPYIRLGPRNRCESFNLTACRFAAASTQVQNTPKCTDLQREAVSCNGLFGNNAVFEL
jgi:hypothetical protein